MTESEMFTSKSLSSEGYSQGLGGLASGNASYAMLIHSAEKQQSRRWAVELAARIVSPPDLIAKAREILAFVEEAPDAG